ncbi:MAG: hypothetical protein ACT4P1_11210 [Sporichthyaceae bacterium]
MPIVLTHLTFIGAAVPPASVEFGPKLTLVRGPSDTGKSYIVDAIDFMLGASALKEIPERVGYSTVLLGIELPTGDAVTLARAVTGGKVFLFKSDVREGPLAVPDEQLSAKHSSKNARNLSRYLLQHLDLEGKRIRKNSHNETDSLSFRNLAHLCVVDETRMQADTKPALTGNFTTRTKEISVFKLLLQDEDDAGLVATDSGQEGSRVVGARLEVINRLLGGLETKLAETPESSELRDQLVLLIRTIEQQSSAVAAILARRSTVGDALRRSQQSVASAWSELSDLVALRGRFELLQQQYDSDLDRLATIREAGTLLGYFTPGTCVFCGAVPADQHFNIDCEGDETAFHASVEAEMVKTVGLRGDLVSTLADMADRRAELLVARQAEQSRAEELVRELNALDAELTPQNDDLRQLLSVRSEVEKSLGFYDQISDLERMKTQIEDEAQTGSAAAATQLSLSALREFSAELSQRLADWGYPEADAVRYDRAEQDIHAGDQYRAAHGKGVRAILHAAFTLGLAQYCLDREIAHPGFVVLDSPLVTYRPPDAAADEVLDPSLPVGVVAAFYRDVQARFDGQVIVMENLDPTEPLQVESKDIVFTRRNDRGRYGFFPPRPHGGEG